eukprot:gene1272-8057_t
MLAEVPCASAQRDPEFAPLARRWEALMREAPAEAAAQLLLSLGHGGGGGGIGGGRGGGVGAPAPFTAAGRFALHWTLGICGKGRATPFWRASPVGPDGLLTTLACTLGPTAAKACWASCNGTMSQAHAAASLGHVRLEA